ncbi:MAG: hypothetical protein J5I91_06740 [Bacteroidetes bacterium]|nr:hypothetical protein [Bacteroidota bacterium]
MYHSILRNKLDSFISKYHRMQLLRGVVAVVGIFLSTYLIAALLEYYGRFGTGVRAVLFFSILAVTLWVVTKNIVIPLLQLFKLSKGTLSYEKASLIIGNHFPEVQDKLLNALQLETMSESGSNNELLLAAIEQKTKEISGIPFLNAITWEGVKKVAKYSLIPVSLFLIAIIFNSGVFLESGERIIHFKTHYAIPAPFKFLINENNPKIYRNQDYTVELQTPGDQIPSEMFIISAGNTMKMESVSKGKFSFTFRNIQSTRSFHFTTGKYSSGEYTLTVIPKPIILNFNVALHYPAYLQKKNETLDNVGDLTIPAGTQVIWTFKTKDADKLKLYFDTVQKIAQRDKDNNFVLNQRFLHNTAYQVSILNSETKGVDSIGFHINIIADEYPSIFSEQQKDSNMIYTNYLFGEASDDNGISRLTFFYKTVGKEENYKKIELPVSGTFKQNFFLPVNLKDLGIEQNQELEYYFQVWDNDKVLGPKSTKTSTQTLKRESDKELENRVSETGKALQANMQNSLQKAAELQEKIKALNNELKQKSNLTWEDKQKIEKLLEEQKKLQEEIEKMKKDFQQRNEYEDQFKNKNEELRKKQEQIQKMFDELFDDKTKELFKKLEEMLMQQNKDKIQEKLNEINKNNKDLENMLDKTLEQFKQYELEKKINETTDKLEKLSEKQEELKKKTENSDKSQNPELQKQQEELNKEFESVQKDLEEIKQKNNNLEEPMKLDDTEESSQDIQSDMNQAEENISKNKKNSATKNQQDAAKKMKELAQKMEQQMQENQQQQNEEDYNTLRQLLKNLVLLSNKQEEIMKEFNNIREYNPRYIELSKKQKELRQSALMIEDSLNNLAKRQPMISSYVTKELGSLTNNMEGAVSDLSERYTGSAVVKQQYAMTHTNNLAVFLTEILQQMQQQMNEEKKKDGEPKDGEPKQSCDNPGQKNQMGKGKPKPGMQGMKQLQDRLNQMMKDMQQQKMNGKNPSSEEFARTAAQQEALRRELERIEKEMGEQGQGNTELMKEIEKTRKMMEETEKQLYNKQLDTRTIQRQEEIAHRLFEHEKAEREQGEDEKRKGETATEKERKIPPSIEKYLKEKAKELEFYKTLPPEFSPYYKDKVKDYFQNLQS